MKKIVSLLVALAMVLSFVPAMPVAHAATNDAPLTNTVKTNNWFQDALETIVGGFKDFVSVLSTPAANSAESLVLGMNNLEVARNEGEVIAEYSYIAEQTGTLYITVVTYSDGNADWGADIFEHPDYSTLTVNGQTVTSLENTISVTAGDEVKIVMSSEDGGYWYAKLHLSYEGPYVPALGSEEIPFELTYDAIAAEAFVVDIPAGEAFWFFLNDIDFDAAIIEVRGGDSYVVQSYRVWGSRNPVEERTDAVDGVLSFNRLAEMVQIGNAGDAAAEFSITAYIPEGIRENPEDLPVNAESVTVDLPGNEVEYFFDWTAPENGTLEITLTGDNWFCAVDNGNPQEYLTAAQAWDSSNVITIYMAQGESIVFVLGTMLDDGGNISFPAASITVSASFTPGEPAPTGDPLVLGENNVTVAAGATTELFWTATETGLLAITMDSDNWTYVINNVTAGVNGQTHSSNQTDPVYMEVVKVTAGDQIKVIVGTADNAAGTVTFNADLCQGTSNDPIYVDLKWEGDNYASINVQMPVGTYIMSGWVGAPMLLLINGVETDVIPNPDPMDLYNPPTFEMTVTDASVPCKVELTYPLGSFQNPGQMVVGGNMTAETNQTTIPAGGMNPGQYCFGWTATQDTLLALNMLGEDWLVSFMVYDAQSNMVHDSSLTSDAAFLVTVEVLKLKAGDRVIVMLQNWNREPCDVSFTAYAAAGTESDPVLLSFAWDEEGNSATLNAVLPVGEYYYGNFGMSGMELLANDELIEIKAGNRWEMKPDSFVINNEEEESYTYEMILSYPEGHQMNPADAVLGDNVADIAAGTQGYYYTWIATEDCTLNVTISSNTGWMYVVNNLTTGIYGDNKWSNTDSNTCSIEVKAGDKIQIIVNTYDPANPYSAPAGQVTVNLAIAGTEHVCAPVDVPLQGATCTEPGVKAHKKCEECGKLYDATTGEEVTPESLVIAKHTQTKVAANGATCTAPGNIEYYTCSCGKWYSDAECKNEITDKNSVVVAKHTQTKVAANGATCTAPGNIEYYTCSCGKWYSDAECKNEITDKNSVVVPATGKHEYVDGKCKHCGAEEPKDILMGDVNGDGAINTRDAKLIMQYELNLIDASKLNVAAADVNGDGAINTRDAKLIMQLELGLITEFPAKKEG